MSDKSGGFFSTMGRFFSGGSATKSKEIEKTSEVSAEDSSTLPSSSEAASAAPASFLRDIVSIDSGSAVESDDIAEDTPRVSASTRLGSSLRYLSPSALEQRNGLEIDVDPVPDIFFTTPSVSTNRKRQLTELDKQALPQSFRSESVKRSRFLNRSLLEPTLKNSLGADKRLDMTWCGELTSNHSPASSITNFSLLSRRSGATTNGSLSTRTQEIYKKLEGASTPAKEIQRMSMLRAGLSRPEKWGNLESASDTPPPLKKAGDGIPSRIQLISKAMSQPRQNPYWRDLTRKRGESKNGDASSSSDTHSLKSLNGNFASAELSSLFSLDAPVPKKSATTTSEPAKSSTTAPKKPHVSILKGPDGKAVSRNTFKLDDEDSEESQPPPLPAATLSNPQPLKLAAGSSAPQRGFLDNLQFTFSAPVDSGVSSVSSKKTTTTSDSDSCEETAEKASSESSSSDSEESEASDDSEDEVEEVKESRPHTSADTISTANGSNQSSTDSSPKIAEVPKVTAPAAPAPIAAPPKPAAAAQWECQACFTNWPATNDKCGCCGTPKEGASAEASKPAEKQLVSNLSAFAPTKPASGGFSFGFGGSSAAPAASGSSAPSAFGTSSSTSLFGASEPAAPVVPAPAPVVSAPTPAPAAPTPAPSSDRVAWECPDCFVSNKASDDKCPCCSHVKYPSAAGAASSNVFGARAFNPTASTGPAVSFGVGSSAAPKPAFGFGAPKTSDAPAPAKAPAPAFGFSAPAAPAPAPTPVAAPIVAPAPAAPTTTSNLLEVPKITQVGSLFGNLPKPADKPPVVAPATSTVPMFGGSGSTSLFGSQSAPKPAETEAPKPSIFGASSTAAPSLTTSGSLFSGSSASSTASTIPPFGGSLFGGSKPAVEAPKPAPTLSFGATSTTEAPKPFGSTPLPTASNSLFSAGSTSSGLFGKPADSTTSTAPSLFGGSGLKKPISFGGDVGTTTTDGGAPAKRGMFSLDPPSTANTAAPKLAFGGNTPFGTTPAPTSSGSLFSGSTGMFGGPATTTSTSAFGSTGSTIGFGGAPAAAPAFGGFGKQPGMSTSSSTNSLFGATAPDSSNPFASSVTSSSTNNNGGFNFSSSSSTASTSSNNGGVFQFGGVAPAPSTAAAGQPFQFGGLPPAPAAPGSMDNNAFAYQAPTGGGARKMAMARRRNIRK